MGQKDPLAISDNISTSRTKEKRGGATCAWEAGCGAGNHHVVVGSRKGAGLDCASASLHWIVRLSHGTHTES